MAVPDTTTIDPPAYGPPDSDARPEQASWNPWPRVWEDIVSERRARVPLPARAHQPQHRAHPADVQRPAVAAALPLRALRPDLQHADPLRAHRVHDRAGGEPLHHGLASAQLPLARGQLRRPDPAARRRPADDRRRLSRPRPPDHDARLPSRADRGGGRGDDERDRGRARRACDPARPSTSTTGRATWRCGSRCARCSASTRTTAATARRRPSTSSARSASTGSTTTCGSCAGRARPGAG